MMLIERREDFLYRFGRNSKLRNNQMERDKNEFKNPDREDTIFPDPF